MKGRSMEREQQYSLRDYYAAAEKHLAKTPGTVINFKVGGRIITAVRCDSGAIELSGLAIKAHTPPTGAQIRAVG